MNRKLLFTRGIIRSLVLVLMAASCGPAATVTPASYPIPTCRPIPNEDEYTLLDRVLETPVGRELTEEQKDGVLKLEQASDNKEVPIQLHINSLTGEPVWIKLKLEVETPKDPVENALTFLKDYGDVFRVEELGELELAGEAEETECCFVVHFSQKVDGVLVYGAGLEIIQDKAGWIRMIHANLLPNVTSPQTTASPVEDARGLLEDYVPFSDVDEARGEIVILDSRLFDYGSVTSYLAWHFASPSDAQGLVDHYFLDASTSNLIAASDPLVMDASVNVLQAGEDFSSPIYHVNSETGVPDYVSWQQVGGCVLAASSATPEEAVYEFLESNKEMFLDGDPRRHQKVEETRSLNDIGFTVIQTRQYYGDLPVFGIGYRYFVAPGNSLWSIHGNYIPHLKVNVDDERRIDPDTARYLVAERLARSKCPTCDDSELRTLTEEEAGKISQPPVLGIYPQTIATPPRQSSSPSEMADNWTQTGDILGDLAYQIQTNDRMFYISAITGDVLYSYITIETDEDHGSVNVYDANKAQREDYHDFVDEDFLGDRNTNADVGSASDAAHATLDYWYNRDDLFPYSYSFLDDVMDNDGEAVHLIVNAQITPDPCENAYHSSTGTDIMVFCPGFVQPDIVAHEMTHGVTDHSSELIYADESGALAESYSDLFGELVFPDPLGTWHLGSSIRDLANPRLPYADHMRNYQYPRPDCPGNYDDDATCDNGYVHWNSGIPSLAAVYISDGVPALQQGSGSIPGIGRDKLAALSFRTLVTILDEWSGLPDAMLGTVEACHQWREWGLADAFSPPLLQSDCDVIANAWSRVGIDPNTSRGWYRSSGVFAGSEDVPFGGGMYNRDIGCTVRGCLMELTNLDDPGMHVACTDKSICPAGGVVGNTLSYSNGEFSAEMDCYSIGTALEGANVHIERSSFEDIGVILYFVPSVPSGVTEKQCFGDVITPASGEIHHWSDWGLGGKDDEWAGPSTDMPTGCVLTRAILQKLNEDGEQVGDTGIVVGNWASGARIISSSLGTNHRQVQVHWWFNSLTDIRYKVLYTIVQPPDVQCWP